MSGLLSIIREAGFERLLPCERVSLDYDHLSEYQDSDEHPAQEPFKRPVLETSKRKVQEIQSSIRPILSYFLDGSRRTHKVADVILEGRSWI